GSPEGGSSAAGMDAQDVLHAWRDFECSFFAGALLAPKVPFRRFLTRERHRVEAGVKLELTPAVIMRRMTKVSPYPYWHFFRSEAAPKAARARPAWMRRMCCTRGATSSAVSSRAPCWRRKSRSGGFSRASGIGWRRG